jgi:hypothetical protein
VNFGIPYRLRDPRERSSHSTQMLRVTSETRGRRTGKQYFRGRSAKCVQPNLNKGIASWKAVCAETCTHGLGRGGEKRVERYLARRLLYLWRTIKQEEVYLNDYATPREARQGLSTYLRFYNEERIHQSLDYRTPVEVYFAQ